MDDNEAIATSLPMTTSNDRLDRIEALVEGNSTAIARLSVKLDAVTADVEHLVSDTENVRQWEDQTWDVIKWVGGISAALSISAAIALVGLVIRLSLTGQ
jgi:hypothetical protein